MIKLTKEDVLSLYSKVKQKAFREYKRGNIEKALKSISVASIIAYKLCFIYKDDDLEHLLSDISSELLPKNEKETLLERYVLIDAFGTPNKGLTQQYLRGLISMNVDFLYVSENVLDSRKEIYNEVIYSEKGKLCLVSKGKEEKRIKYVYDQVTEFQPSVVLAHISPWDVVATTVLYALPQCVRYNINLTDHAFWLGSGCFDYTLEFRNYGCTVSAERRGFDLSQILLNPYYPIIDDTKFLGFPNINKEQVILFSGGAYYKIYGENYAFLHMIKHILSRNLNSILLFAGSGDEKPFRRFLQETHLEDRVFLIGHRKDINQVFAHCDIYLGTYPFAGGLMTQYAAYNSKPVVAFTKTDVTTNKIEDLIFQNDEAEIKLTYTDLDKYYSEIDRLILDVYYRREKGKILKRALMKKTDFDLNLKRCLSEKIGNQFSTMKINYDERFSWYLELLNINAWEIGRALFKIHSIFSAKLFLKCLPFLFHKVLKINK